MLKAGQESLPFTNTRLLLAEEAGNEDSYFLGSGVVVRLFSSPTSHPAVRQTLQGLHSRRVSLGALAVQALVNKRGPDGVVGVIPGEDKHSARLLSLCQSCHDQGEVLACSLPSADMVLVPRLPATAAQDGLYFLAYATNLKAVELCERLRQQKQVALVLDLDNTLVDAAPCSIAPNDWPLLDWRYVLVTNSYGRQLQAQYAPLPGHDPFSEDVWVMHWKVGRVSCTFKVRIRRGWADLRDFLTQHAAKYAVYVCSKGKREYIQLLWLMLDPLGQLIPQSDWDARLTSTYPDTLTQAANKTALTALGCYDITKPHVPTQVAVPMMCLDDSTEAYEPEYEHSVMYCQEYRPSDLRMADNGNVLRQARERLEAFWTATCASEGTFAWQAAQSFAMALMKTMQRNPMGSPNDLSYLQVRCAKQGEALWHQFTVREVFGDEGVFIADDPSKDDGPRSSRSGHAPGDGPLCATCQLPECKPGCPGTAAMVSGAGLEAAHSSDARATPGGGHAAAAAAAAEDAAFSEGRSSEDSVLLAMPSPTFSVLPGQQGAPLHRLSADGGSSSSAGGMLIPGAIFTSSAGGGGSGSPPVEPPTKQPRLGSWKMLPDAAAAVVQHHQQEVAALAGGSDGWAYVQHRPQPPPQQQLHQQQEAAAAPAPPESALAAALRGISRGLEAELLNAPPPPAKKQPPPPPAPAAQQQGGGGGNSALAAALAAISKGLAEDGLL